MTQQLSKTKRRRKFFLDGKQEMAKSHFRHFLGAAILSKYHLSSSSSSSNMAAMLSSWFAFSSAWILTVRVPSHQVKNHKVQNGMHEYIKGPRLSRMEEYFNFFSFRIKRFQHMSKNAACTKEEEWEDGKNFEGDFFLRCRISCISCSFDRGPTCFGESACDQVSRPLLTLTPSFFFFWYSNEMSN